MEYLLLGSLLFFFLYLVFEASSFATSFLWQHVLRKINLF